jgi:hypothetical protein
MRSAWRTVWALTGHIHVLGSKHQGDIRTSTNICATGELILTSKLKLSDPQVYVAYLYRRGSLLLS